MKKWIKQSMKDLPIFQKMFMLCMLVTVSISLLSGGITYAISSEIILDKTIAQTEETINQLSENYDSFMEIITNRVDYIAFNPTVQDELINGKPEETEEGYYSGSRVVKRLLVQMFKSNQMEDIEIYGENGKNYFCSIRGTDEPILKNETELKEIAAENIGAVTYINDISASGCLQVVKQIKDNLAMEPIGMLRTGIRLSALERIQKNVNFASSGTILLLDEQNQTIIGDESELTLQASGLFNKWNDSFQYEIDGSQYQIVYQVSDYTGFKTIGILPADEISYAIKPVKKAMLITLISGILLSIALSAFMARFIGKPIEKTVFALRDVSKGDFKVRLQDDRKDEFGEINREFNYTIERMEYLLEEIAQSRMLNKEMEVKALQAQINPHFLYNALDTINWMARKEDKEEICDMISAVSNLLRTSISNKENLFTVEKELNYVKDYIYIQQTRYRSRFETIFEIEEQMKSQLLPKLTIQPLVENAIVHSVEISKAKTVLSIKAYHEKHDAWIEIRDNGVGMPKETADNLLKPPKDKVDVKAAHTGLGVYAVHQRLQYMFGEEYGLKTKSREGVGTCITIHFPYEVDEIKLRERANTFLK
ncbi:MAG: sensor histidine kinase [Lachnospiraceae bacterium]|nr:sensor histidine kinase [Lachnospiraceae bacterium]MDD3616274.1 sensor histidine kinase [Lachnospiraceae bacterium]